MLYDLCVLGGVRDHPRAIDNTHAHHTAKSRVVTRP